MATRRAKSAGRYAGLRQLGARTTIPASPEAAELERVPNPHPRKLYLTSFRDHGAFHEDCTLAIAGRLVEFLAPRWLRVAGYWYPRGGMPIDVFWQTGRPPAGLWIPDPGVAPYRGRG
jgi:7-cyano-7-deazaguanine reductase